MGAVIGVLGGRLMAYVLLGGGFLLVLGTLYQGAKHKGAAIADNAWHAVISANVKQSRESNHHVDEMTLDANASLEEQERMIRRRWATAGRDGTPQPEPRAMGVTVSKELAE